MITNWTSQHIPYVGIPGHAGIMWIKMGCFEIKQCKMDTIMPRNIGPWIPKKPKKNPLSSVNGYKHL